MHKSIPALAALAFLVLPASSFADGAQTPTVQPAVSQPVTAQPVTAQPASAQPASRKLICKEMVHEGMLVKTNVCHTQAEWDRIRTDQQRNVSEFQNRTYQTSGH